MVTWIDGVSIVGTMLTAFGFLPPKSWENQKFLIEFESGNCGSCRGFAPVVELWNQGNVNIGSTRSWGHPWLDPYSITTYSMGTTNGQIPWWVELNALHSDTVQCYSGIKYSYGDSRYRQGRMVGHWGALCNQAYDIWGSGFNGRRDTCFYLTGQLKRHSGAGKVKIELETLCEDWIRNELNEVQEGQVRKCFPPHLDWQQRGNFGKRDSNETYVEGITEEMNVERKEFINRNNPQVVKFVSMSDNEFSTHCKSPYYVGANMFNIKTGIYCDNLNKSMYKFGIQQALELTGKLFSNDTIVIENTTFGGKFTRTVNKLNKLVSELSKIDFSKLKVNF